MLLSKFEALWAHCGRRGQLLRLSLWLGVFGMLSAVLSTLFVTSGWVRYACAALTCVLWTGALSLLVRKLAPYLRFERDLRNLTAQAKHSGAQELLDNHMDTYQSLSTLLHTYLGAVHQSSANDLLLKQAQFSVLQNQINPHFLYNTLDAIRGEAVAMGADSIAQMTEALSRFFRYNISQQTAMVSVAAELDNIQNYFLIQKYRFGDRLILEVDTKEADGLDTHLIPKLTLQPLVENAIVHGIEPSPRAGTVRVRVTTTAKHLVIVVEDNGLGMTAEKLETFRRKLDTPVLDEFGQIKGGIALHNVHARIQTLCGAQYGLRVASAIGLGTEVEIFLPLLTRETVPAVAID